MAADDKTSTTSHMRVLQFNDKVAALNREFIKQLQRWSEQCPHYDFSDSIRSYLEHIDRLDKMYSATGHSNRTISGNGGQLDKTALETPVGGGRVIAKAKRRMDKSGDDNQSNKISTPAGNPPSRFSFGNVSAISVADSTLTQSPPSGTINITMKPAPPVVNAPTPSVGGGRKRAIRGGGSNGEAESVVFRSADNASVAPTYPKTLVNLPKMVPGFWDKHKTSDSGDVNSKPEIPVFKFNTSVAPIVPTSETLKTEDKDAPKTTSLFESAATTAVSKTPVFGSGNMPPSMFAPKASGESASPGLFFGFGAKKADEANDSSTAVKPLAFPSLGSSTAVKPLAFPSFGSSTNSLVGSAAGLGQPAAGLSFAPAADAKPAESTNEGGEDNEEYVPPKAEVVEAEEPDATFSTRCSVFKMVDKKYTKMGVGMLHLKDAGGTKSVLVRAATTTGTVWMNALINGTMKTAKADDKGEKLTVMYPISEMEMGTFLIRFANAATTDKVMAYVNDNSK